MPYTEDRGVWSYHGRDTPMEFASGEDEDRHRFNKARDEAFATAEALCGALDDLYSDPIAEKANVMAEVADQLAALLKTVKEIGA